MPGIQNQPQASVVHPKAEALAQNLERLAWLMDRAIPIPGTKLRVGLDAILGLFPGAGDVVTGVVQASLVLVTLSNYRVPKAVAARMVANVALDNVIGLIPMLGDAFDVGFKANTRNMALLKEVRDRQHHGEAMPSAPSVKYLVMIGAILVGILGTIFLAVVAISAYIVKLIFAH